MKSLVDEFQGLIDDYDGEAVVRLRLFMVNYVLRGHRIIPKDWGFGTVTDIVLYSIVEEMTETVDGVTFIEAKRMLVETFGIK